MDLAPLALSLQVATVATLLAIIAGIPLAWTLARRRFPGRDLLAVLVVLPMVLPPTVLGYALLVALGRQGPFDPAVRALFGDGLVFTPAAAVVAAFVASTPFLVRAALGGIEQLDLSYEEAARTLGRRELGIFLTVTVPLAWRGIVAGIALCFARAIGEFGAVLVVSGSVAGLTETSTLFIFRSLDERDAVGAHGMALVLAAVSFTLLMAMELVRRRGARQTKRTKRT